MKSKQEVIQEAWEQWGIPYSEKYVDENGFIDMKQDLPEIVDGALLSIKYSAEGHKDFDYKGGLYRPKSLQGIENNNGWTRIESVDDLPSSGMKNYMYCVDGKPSVFVVNLRVLLSLSKDGMVSHYMALPSPEAPIY